MDKQTRSIGFRRVRLVQNDLAEADYYGTGSTFFFEVNNVRIFMGGEAINPPSFMHKQMTSLCFLTGSNWVPGDSLLTTMTPDRYRAWLEMLRDGNQNMVRLWGGGVYEPDVFYEICDGEHNEPIQRIVSVKHHLELGILVWQDFQFACGVYPAHPAFVESVQLEAEDNVRRLRHHPSIALFCGNNEGRKA